MTTKIDRYKWTLPTNGKCPIEECGGNLELVLPAHTNWVSMPHHCTGCKSKMSDFMVAGKYKLGNLIYRCLDGHGKQMTHFHCLSCAMNANKWKISNLRRKISIPSDIDITGNSGNKNKMNDKKSSSRNQVIGESETDDEADFDIDDNENDIDINEDDIDDNNNNNNNHNVVKNNKIKKSNKNNRNNRNNRSYKNNKKSDDFEKINKENDRLNKQRGLYLSYLGQKEEEIEKLIKTDRWLIIN